LHRSIDVVFPSVAACLLANKQQAQLMLDQPDYKATATD
jgi:hypothetical protein